MDRLPLTAASLAIFFHIKGSEVERYYKHHLSDFETWTQKEHATDWVLLSENLGACCSIDETSLYNEVYTIVSNKDGHGKKGTVIAIRVQLHGIADNPFFLYRACTIFG